MNESIAPRQATLVMHALLVGLTPLIPLPLADDLAQQYLQQRMIRTLAYTYGVPTTDKDLQDATKFTPAGKGCLSGCLVSALTYPFKKLARKIFFALEIKRAVDLTSYTYHYGYLLDYALQQALVGGPNGRSWGEMDAILDDVCRTAPLKPVEAAIGVVFRQSKNLLLLPVRLIEKQLRGNKPTPESVQAGLQAARTEENQEALNTLAERMQNALAAVPQTHFDNLRSQLREKLNSVPPAKLTDKSS